MIVWTAKDPNEELDYSWIVPLDTGDSIDSFTASKVSGSATLGDTAISSATVQIWASGGTADELVYFSLVVVTANGRTFREGAILPIVDRAAELLANFRMNYPAFITVDDGPIGYWLAKAGGEVGTNWPAADRDDAKAAWAAHMLSLTGVLPSATPGGVTNFRSGDFSATIDSAVAQRTGLESTIYGQEFIRLRRRAFAGPRMAWTPPASV